MPTAQIIAIGTELLLGVTQDTNTSFIARTLNQHGVDIFKTSTIGDNEERIAREIRTSLEQADIIITTGGLGPTVDDPTRQAVARAFDVELEFRAELWEQIKERFRGFGREPSENNKRQAHLPHGARAIPNPVGTAPAFAFERDGKTLISLPGVPSEMKTLLLDDVIPLLQETYNLAGTTLSRTLHISGMGESNIDELVADLETLSNPTVGLAAHPGLVDIRITAKAASAEEARELIRPVEEQVRQRLGIHIHGADGESLPDVLTELVKGHGLALDIFYDPRIEEFTGKLAELSIFNSIQALPADFDPDIYPDIPTEESLYNDNNKHDYLLLLASDEKERTVVMMDFYLNGKFHQQSRSFGGHLTLYPQWMNNHILSFIRETIIQEKGDICKK